MATFAVKLLALSFCGSSVCMRLFSSNAEEEGFADADGATTGDGLGASLTTSRQPPPVIMIALEVST